MFPETPSNSQSAGTPSTPPPAQPKSTSRRGGRLAATVVSVALFGGLIGVAADRWAVSNFGQNPLNASSPTVTTGPRIGPIAAPNGSGQTAQAAPTATAPTDPNQQAIQQVIQQGDNEQAQAFSNNDPTVMQDTSTSDFYQSQVGVNQDLRDNGVTDIKLINIDWGQINVTGANATATAWETWTTTYSDGTTEQSRDRNEYTLVQQTVSGSGSTQYQAWVETLPQASHPVPLTINPGDSISISITQSPQAQDQWQVSYKNDTTGQTYQVTEHYTSSLSSAEWIEEAPSAARGRQIPLDNFGSIDFSVDGPMRATPTCFPLDFL